MPREKTHPGPHPLPVSADVAWAVFAVACLAGMVTFAHWASVPFFLIWISLAVLYGARLWPLGTTALVVALLTGVTLAATAWDVSRHAESVLAFPRVVLTTALFCVMAWHMRRRLSASNDIDLVNEQNARLLASQRQFFQDASHQVRTPITIALGHAELLASQLAGQPEARDIEVVVGELGRLRRLGERLLMIAACEDAEFLRPEPVSLRQFVLDIVDMWAPTARRHWSLGRCDPVAVLADRERLRLAVEALLENAVRHSGEGAPITLAVVSCGQGAHLVVTDGGEGIPADELGHIFERFRASSPPGGARGTGLGLALVRAVALAHGGEVLVRSSPGAGSEFQIVLPLPADARSTPVAAEAVLHPPGACPAARGVTAPGATGHAPERLHPAEHPPAGDRTPANQP